MITKMYILIALLDFRNTPGHLGLSPAQIMFNLRTRTRLPMAHDLLESQFSHEAHSKLVENKHKQAIYYNRGAKERKSLKVGQTCRVKIDDRKTSGLRKGQISKIHPFRSYDVKLENQAVYRRNSKHIRPTSESIYI